MSKKFLILFLIAFSFKFTQLTWLKKLSDSLNPERSISTLAIISGDTHSYLNPFKNLLKEGIYYEKKPAGNIAYAGRLPIYGLIYYLTKPFMSDNNIYNIYVILYIMIQKKCIIINHSFIHCWQGQSSQSPADVNISVSVDVNLDICFDFYVCGNPGALPLQPMNERMTV